ncbi:MAG: DUF3501 family protein [Candidatus Latescibacteria bacterium]|nr:DUF3501 family protein [Candidatus Latescibacterota bacterium]
MRSWSVSTARTASTGDSATRRAGSWSTSGAARRPWGEMGPPVCSRGFRGRGSNGSSAAAPGTRSGAATRPPRRRAEASARASSRRSGAREPSASSPIASTPPNSCAPTAGSPCRIRWRSCGKRWIRRRCGEGVDRMDPIRIEEIKDPAGYDRVRADIRRRVLEARTLRRIRVGERFSVVFETRETILFQLQETLRAEAIHDPEDVARELELANELLPPPLHLFGVLYVEWTDPAGIRGLAEDLSGIEAGERLRIDVGEAEAVPGRFLRQRTGEGPGAGPYRLRFPFSAEAADRFRRLDRPAALVLDHARHGGRAPIEGPTRRALAADLSGPA